MSNRPYTQEQFLKVCKKIHNNKYDYSKVEYNGIWSYIEIICPIHGQFTQRAVQHRRGFDCTKCRFGELLLPKGRSFLFQYCFKKLLK